MEWVMRLLLALSIACIAAQPVSAQGMLESGGVRAFSAGLGAGLAGSLGHGAIVRQTYETALEAQKALAEQTRVVNDYCSRGAQFEAKKQWAYAEAAYKYVLAVISHRDGPGSPNALPVLAHLSKISKQQNKLDDAIYYQKTVVAMTQGSKKPEPKAVLSAQRELGSLFIQKHDYAAARNALQKEVALFDQYPTLPREELTVSMEVYGKVLGRLEGSTGASDPPIVVSSPPNAGTPPTAPATQLESSVVPVAHVAEPTAVSAPAATAVSAPAATAVSAPETASVAESPASDAAAPKFLEEPKPEKPTAEQEELSKAHLFGADPLPSEVELRHELFGAPTPESAQPTPTAESPAAAQSATGQNATPAPTTETQAPSDSPQK
jgi:hypothetical protein